MSITPRHPSLARGLALLLSAMLLTAWFGWASSARPAPLAELDGQTRTMTVGGERFVVEIASTPTSRQRGLMGRSRLPADHGMLFLYAKEAPRTFWMRNVHFALDILYLDADWRIVDRVASAPPCLTMPCGDYPSSHPARYVLELPAGSSNRLGLAPGEQLTPPSRLP